MPVVIPSGVSARPAAKRQRGVLRRGAGALLVGVALALWVCAPLSGQERGGEPAEGADWGPSSCREADLPDLQRAFGSARAVLRGAATPVEGGADAPCRIFLSASRGEGPARVALGHGAGLESAAADAAARLRPLLESASTSGEDRLWLQIDLVREVRVIAGRESEVPWPRGVFGLAEASPAGRFLLPGELLSHNLIDSRGRYRPDRQREFDQSFPERAREDRPPRWGRLLATRAFFDDGSGVRPLYRGQYERVPLGADGLLQAARAAGRYLAAVVRADGSFDYEYQPKSDRSEDDYNLLRHAGTVYALLELHAATGDDELLDAAQRALVYLAAQVRACRPPGRGLCAVEDDESKLGGNGLAVLALSQLSERTPEQSVLAVGLGERILDLLQEDGSFWPHKIRFSDGKASGFVSEYYPGEAIYALARLFSITGERRWLDAARRAADHRVQVVYVERQGARSEDLVHDHWLAYGLAELAVHGASSPADLAYLERLARSIVAAQHPPPPPQEPERSATSGSDAEGYEDPRDWAGGFYIPPRSAPTATRAEALAAILRTLPRGSNPDLEERIGAALCAAIAFQLRAQFTPPRALYLADPQRVLGAISRSLTDFGVRIDYPQHTISSLLAAARLQGQGRMACESPASQ